MPIYYQFIHCVFGNALIASTDTGICYFGFIVDNDKEKGYRELISRFPHAILKEQKESSHQTFITHLSRRNIKEKIVLHLAGTPFQRKTWEALLKIPHGKFATYGSIAKFINHPNAFRAVGTAVGMNPVSIMIPCHRVIQSNGELGGYHWGINLKKRLIDSEKESFQKMNR